MFGEVGGGGGADDVDAEVVFAGIFERAVGELGGEAVSAKGVGDLGVFELEDVAGEGVFEIGDVSVALEFEASGSDLLGRFFASEHGEIIRGWKFRFRAEGAKRQRTRREDWERPGVEVRGFCFPLLGGEAEWFNAEVAEMVWAASDPTLSPKTGDEDGAPQHLW